MYNSNYKYKYILRTHFFSNSITQWPLTAWQLFSGILDYFFQRLRDLSDSDSVCQVVPAPVTWTEGSPVFLCRLWSRKCQVNVGSAIPGTRRDIWVVLKSFTSGATGRANEPSRRAAEMAWQERKGGSETGELYGVLQGLCWVKC